MLTYMFEKKKKKNNYQYNNNKALDKKKRNMEYFTSIYLVFVFRDLKLTLIGLFLETILGSFPIVAVVVMELIGWLVGLLCEKGGTTSTEEKKNMKKERKNRKYEEYRLVMCV